MPNALWSQNLSKAVESGLQYLLGEQARRASRGLFSNLCCWMRVRLNERVVMCATFFLWLAPCRPILKRLASEGVRRSHSSSVRLITVRSPARARVGPLLKCWSCCPHSSTLTNNC